MSSTRFISRLFAALTALLLAAGLFAWMNAAGDDVARVAETLRKQPQTIKNSSAWSPDVAAQSRAPVADDLTQSFELAPPGLVGAVPVAETPPAWDPEASEEVENPFGLLCDWGLGGCPFGVVEMALMLGTGGLGGLLAAVLAAPVSRGLRRCWANRSRIARAARRWLGFAPNWTIGLIVAAVLTGGLVAGGALASRTFGTDAQWSLERSADAAEEKAREVYLRTGQAPYYIGLLPPGHSYHADGDFIRYCGPVAFGSACETRDLRVQRTVGEVAGPFRPASAQIPDHTFERPTPQELDGLPVSEASKLEEGEEPEVIENPFPLAGQFDGGTVLAVFALLTAVCLAFTLLFRAFRAFWLAD